MHELLNVLEQTLTCEGLVWETPEGSRILDRLTFALGAEKTALVGDNGVGKTTMARLLVGDLQPSAGVIRRTGTLAWLPQSVEARQGEPIARTLGIEEQLDAIAAIEAGACGDRLFERVGDRWDIAERAAAITGRLGLPRLDLSTPLDRLSGGEAMRVALAGCLLAEPDLLVLDEPTNHLDTSTRLALYEILDGWRKGLLVISHDRALLRRMDRTLQLSRLGLRSYGGGWDHYQRQVAVERQAARHQAEVAAARLGNQQRAAQAARQRQDRRAASGRRSAARSGASKLEIQAAKRQAERTSGRLGKLHESRLAEARQALDTARDQLCEPAVARADLSESAVPAGKVMIEAEGVNVRWAEGPWLWPAAGVSLRLMGPIRLALEGPSGCGKSTLARVLIGDLKPGRGRVRLGEPRVAWLDQRCQVLGNDTRLLDGMLAANPELSTRQVYWALDRFQLGRQAADRDPTTLSGGERMRAALACLFGVRRPPRLLVLDEPTNNLDISTVQVLEEALAAYQGALILISHDPDFVSAVGVDQRLEVNALAH